MTLKSLHIANKRFTLAEMTIAASTQKSLEAEAALIFSLFQEREKSFGFNPGVVVEYPKIDSPDDSPFLADPLRYIAARCGAMRQQVGRPLGRL